MRPAFLHKALFAALIVPLGLPLVAHADVYHATPKLVVILVIDQFRGDYLDRYRDALTQPNGFNLFLRRGAYFNDCMFDYANTKTAPGHATIGTGAYTDGHGIGSNEWWDLARNTVRPVSSVEDPRYRLVGTFDDLPPTPTGLPAASPIPGASPFNLLATTIGDELRLATNGESRVYGISLKDRAAILPAGQAANGAFWIDNTTGRFQTSTYYMKQLPAWATAFNKGPRPLQAIHEAGLAETTQFYALVGRTPAANSYELDFAQDLIANEHLGQGKTTDLLTISLSANDIAGHQMGPDSDSQREMVLGLDRDLNTFFSSLDKSVGLSNVIVALTADHGIAPIPSDSAQLGIASSRLDLEEFTQKMDAALATRFAAASPAPAATPDVVSPARRQRENAEQDRSALGTALRPATTTPGQPDHFLLPTQELPYIALNPSAFKKRDIPEARAELAFEDLLPGVIASMGAPAPPPVSTLTPDYTQQKFAESRLATDPNIVFARSRTELASGRVPDTEFGHLISHSYTAHGGWYVMVVPQAYQMELLGDIRTTHFSPWSYDRHVPLGFFGPEFVPGTYRQPSAPVDIAATLASLLGINRPSAAVGRVLMEALKPPQPNP
jgi:predicted AlkP superfamily pyrophosphatase or phosphodiesterase